MRAVASAALLGGEVLEAADFQIFLEGMHEGRQPDLALYPLPKGNYGIEVSADLKSWTKIYSAASQGGVLRYRHTTADPGASLFYRGVQLADPADPEVIPVLDPLIAAATVVTPEGGGSMTMTGPDGTVYTFSVAPRNVVVPAAISMRLVSGFSLFPYETGKRSAVVFEPDGFEFDGAGALEIRYPGTVEHLKISSFAFDGQGTGWHLVPDAAYPDRVVIPVSHFSGVGAAFWEANPRAAAIEQSVTNARDGMAHDVAGKMGQERQRQLLGEEPNPDSLKGALDRMQEYLDRHLKPFFAEARTNCGLAKTLTREILGMERQRQLLGLGDDEADSFLLGSGEYAIWICHCLADLIKACEEGRISDKTFIRELLAYERQSQLLGLDQASLEACGFGSLSSFLERFQTRSLPCIPDWTGMASYADGGSRTWDCSGGAGTCTETATASLAFDAEVETAEITDEFSFPPFYTMTEWKLTFRPTASGSFTSNQRHSHQTGCGAVASTTSMTSGSVSGPMTIEMTFKFVNGELSSFVLDDEAGLKVDSVETTTTTTTPCEGATEGGSTHTGTFSGIIFLSPMDAGLDDTVFSKKTETELKGALTGRRIGIDGIDMPFSWNFHVVRQASGN
jgi:hypothetical protein